MLLNHFKMNVSNCDKTFCEIYRAWESVEKEELWFFKSYFRGSGYSLPMRFFSLMAYIQAKHVALLMLSINRWFFYIRISYFDLTLDVQQKSRISTFLSCSLGCEISILQLFLCFCPSASWWCSIIIPYCIARSGYLVRNVRRMSVYIYISNDTDIFMRFFHRNGNEWMTLTSGTYFFLPI